MTNLEIVVRIEEMNEAQLNASDMHVALEKLQRDFARR
jgi:hypothetical protein